MLTDGVVLSILDIAAKYAMLGVSRLSVRKMG